MLFFQCHFHVQYHMHVWPEPNLSPSFLHLSSVSTSSLRLSFSHLSMYPVISFCLPVPEAPCVLYYFEFEGSLVRMLLGLLLFSRASQMVQALVKHARSMYNKYQIPTLWRSFQVRRIFQVNSRILQHLFKAVFFQGNAVY